MSKSQRISVIIAIVIVAAFGIYFILGQSGESGSDGSAFLTIHAYDRDVCSSVQLAITSDETTALGALTAWLNSEGMSYSASGGYVSMIDGLAEGDLGERSGWLFKVNGEMASEGAETLKLHDGDELYWYFTDDYMSEFE